MKTFGKLIALCVLVLIGRHGYGQFQNAFIKATVYSKPFLDSEVLGEAFYFDPVLICYKSKAYKDTIEGKEVFWWPVVFNNQAGYIHLSDAPYRNTSHISNLNNSGISITGQHTDSVHINFMVFRNRKLIHEKKFRIPPDFHYLTSIGKTRFSDNDVFAIHANTAHYELFEWTGEEIIRSEIEMDEDSKITNQYRKYPYSYINTDSAALHIASDTNSRIAYYLPEHALVKVLQAHVNDKTLWHKIEYNKQILFIAYDDLCLTHHFIKSNKYKDYFFLHANNAIFALQNDSIVDKLPIPVYWRREDFYEISSLGVDWDLDFLGIRMVAHTEGHPSGQEIISWDGKELNYLCADLSSGDFGYYGGHSFDFPYENNALQNEVLSRKFDISYFDSPFNCGTLDFIIQEETKKMVLQGDSLAETTSKYLDFRNQILKEFPDYYLHHASYFDLDKNGQEDAVAYISKPKPWTDSADSPKIVVAFSKLSGKLKKPQVLDLKLSNKTLAVNFLYAGDILSVNILEPYTAEGKEGFYDNYRISFDKIFKKYNFNEKGHTILHHDFQFSTSQKAQLISTNKYIGLGNNTLFFWIATGFDSVCHPYIPKASNSAIKYKVDIKRFEDKFRVWVMDVYYYPFYNDSLNEALIFQTSKSNVHLEAFHFKPDSIPDDFLNDIKFISPYDSRIILNKMKHLEANTYSMKQSDGITLEPDRKYTKTAIPLGAAYFFPAKDIRLGMSVDKLVDLYGAAYVQELSDGHYKFQWVRENKFKLTAYSEGKRVTALKVKYYRE